MFMRYTPMRYTPIVYEVHAYEVHAYEMHAREVHAREVHAHEIHTYETHALEMHAGKVLGKIFRSPTLQTVVRWSILSRFEVAKHEVLRGVGGPVRTAHRTHYLDTPHLFFCPL